LIATDEPDAVKAKLSENGITCTAIGRFTDTGFFERGSSGVIKELLPPEADELYKL